MKQAGDNQTAGVGTTVATPPSVRVVDGNGKAFPGAVVTFAVATGGGTISGSSATTGADGVATIGSWTLGTTSGAQTLSASISANGVTGNPATFTVIATAGAPQTLTKQAGDNAAGTAGVATTTAPAVKIVDQFGNAASGFTVTFAVASGGGTITSAAPVTGADGVAALGSWVLGSVVGANTLTATITASGVTGNPATFGATAGAGAPRTMTKQAGDNGSAAVSTALGTAPSVKLVDQFNNPVAGITVTFAVASGGGTATGTTMATGADGIAKVGTWTLGTIAGANTLTATIANIGVTGNPLTFTATATAAAFNPTSNASLGGAVAYASVTIPAGVIVTITSDLVLTSASSVNIAGTLSGDCRAVGITAATTLTVTGNINTLCSTLPAGTVPTLTLVGNVGYHFTGGGAVTSSGDVLVTNDITLPTSIVSATGLVAPTITRGQR